MRIEERTTKDWQELASFHYRGHRIATPRKIFGLKRGKELCGVIVYGYPPPTCSIDQYLGLNTQLLNSTNHVLNKRTLLNETDRSDYSTRLREASPPGVLG